MSPTRFLAPAPAGLTCVLLVLALGCAHSRPVASTELHAMPAEPGRALAPDRADPDDPGDLAEAALHLLDVQRPGGPDYEGATRLCLFAIDASVARVEAPLRRACFRTAARAALRSGNRELYVDVVDRWDREAPRVERATGELATHLAIRDRLAGVDPGSAARVPPELRPLLRTGSDAR